MKELFVIMKDQILNLSEELLINCTGQEPSLMPMLMKKFTSPPIQSKVLFHMKQLLVMIEIRLG